MSSSAFPTPRRWLHSSYRSVCRCEGLITNPLSDVGRFGRPGESMIEHILGNLRCHVQRRAENLALRWIDQPYREAVVVDLLCHGLRRHDEHLIRNAPRL